jgi:twitching motility protein PilJ
MALLNKLKLFMPGSGGGLAAGSTSSDKKLDTRIALTGGFMMFSILVVVILAYIDSRSHMQRMVYSAIAVEQKLISQDIAIKSLAAVSGEMTVFNQLANSRNRFNQTILILDNGDSPKNLPPLPREFSGKYSGLKNIWKDYTKNVSTIIAAQPVIEAVDKSVTELNESLPQLIALSNGIIKDLVRARAPGRNIELAASQVALLREMEKSLIQILNGGEFVTSAVDRFSNDAIQVEKQLLAMLKGSKSLGIEKFKGAAVLQKLIAFNDLYQDVVKKSVAEVLKNSKELLKVHEAALHIQSNTPPLLKASDDLVADVRPPINATGILTYIAMGVAALSLILMIVFSSSLVRSSRKSLIESQDQNDRNQRAILRLLDEMTNLADGDLSTHTTVTEDITGAIADSVNYSIDALRDLVGTINKTAVQVGGAVRKTQNTTGQLEEASIAQAKEITSASAAITRISQSMSNISEKASDSAEVARKSVGIAHNGGETVRQTIAGMETIREQIQETSKRIKRLGESSQEIGDIVNLITEISDQTNILALNAAIQASMAGEAGRGFAVVADEVQRLAERTGDATKQIEALVKTIQADTNEASVSMEQSTANVVKGAKLTENAGSALDRIEQVSMNLAQRILEISDSTKSQAAETVKITESMGVIQQITLKTSEGSGQASGSIGDLSGMVNAMRKSVAGFKLPGMEAGQDTVVKEGGQAVSQGSKGS